MTILFGLPGAAVDRVEADALGARTVHLRTDDPAAAACPACGVFSTSVRQRRTTRPRDLPYGEVPLAVCWHKAQYRCREAACPRKAFTESIPELPPGARSTGRCRRAAGAAVGSGRSVRSVTEDLPRSWPVVHAAFVCHAAAPSVLGIDETRRGRPRWIRDGQGQWQRLERFETNFVDLAGPGDHAGTPVPRRSSPLNFDEPSKSLQEQIDTTTSGGKLVFHVFGALAEFERDVIRERTQAGLLAARVRGRQGGRPRALDLRRAQIAQALYHDKSNAIADICRTLRVSRATLYCYIKYIKAGTEEPT